MKPEKRQRIMKAAEDLFSRGRFHEITMDGVAQRAGVGKGTIYRYFKDKDTLFFEVALSGFDEMCEMVRTEGARSTDFRTCLVNVCRRVSDFYRSRRQLMHMMQAEERRALWRRGKARELWFAKQRQLVDAIRSILEAGRREGRIREDFTVDVLVVFLLGLLRTRGRQNRRDTGARIENEAIVDLFLHGACGPGKGGRA